MSNPTTVVIAGVGQRGRYAYAPYAKQRPDRMKIVGVADLLPERVEYMAEEYGIDKDKCFSSAEEMFKQPKMADIAFICTQDADHVRHACAAIEKGYDLLLEKPISPDLKDCKKLLDYANEKGRNVTVCHVLRYAKFFQTIKSIIDSGKIGEVVNIDASEHVGYWHQAHSFVRGNWRNSVESSPMILAKSCHDIDILLWLSGKECKRINSFGNTYLFKSEKAPEGAAKRCMDGCKVKDECPYDAEKIYLTDKDRGFINHTDYPWPASVLAEDPTVEKLYDAIKTGPYGRCVYHCDNDVVDHQVLNMEMEDHSTISFTMCAFSKKCYRLVNVMGTLGEISGNIDTETITVDLYGKENEVYNLHVEETISGHGGGDNMLLDSIFALAHGEEVKGGSLTSLDKSMASHFIALASEESRLNNGKTIEMSEFVENIK